jgi:N utilization substance protein B
VAFRTAKQRSRERVVQAVYQCLTSGGEISQVEQEFLNKKDVKISKLFFSNLFLGIFKSRQILDNLINPVLDRESESLGAVEKAALYLGVFELKESTDIPYKVVINEALEVVKIYGAEGAYKLVNHVLDQLAKELRQTEYSAKN